METFPRQHARTRRFTVGAPRSFAIASKNSLISFLQSSSGSDPMNKLWTLNPHSQNLQMLADPENLVKSGGNHVLSKEEQSRRERVREVGSGIVSYSSSNESPNIAFTSGGSLFTANLETNVVSNLETTCNAFDPQVSPSGDLVAYVGDGNLRYIDALGNDRLIVGGGNPDKSYGVADFIAAEEMGRRRGYWWSPEGNRLLVTEVDESDVLVWHILNSSDPSSQPRTLRYPKAGTNNPHVGLSIYSLDGDEVQIDWAQKCFWEYLVNIQWTEKSEIYLTVQTRNQTTMGILRVDSVTGAVEEIYRWTDEYWVEIISGAPKIFGERVITVEDRDESRALVVDNVQVSSSDIQIRSLVHCNKQGVLAAVSTNPLEQHIMHFDLDGGATQLSEGAGVHDAVSNGSLTVIQSRSMDFDGVQTRIYENNAQIAEIQDRSENPAISLNTNFHTLGKRNLETVVLLPHNHNGTTPLPVLLDPYGGPHAQRVRSARGLFGVSQWFADQGFAVIVTDGRGTSGRSPAFEREVYGDLASAALEDQIDALQAAAAIYDQLDLGRVGIRGWSFGGYLAALAVLRRPDIFHAGVAGAPVTDWELYDTHYTERYLGHPQNNPENYQKTNLCNEAHRLERPLLLIHGLADDNVVAAHTFQLSQALLEAGKPHEVLPLSGVTHMTPQETVAENLLRIQLRFIQKSLSISKEEDV
ncbi:MAG: prolyl oligopeptidase family serine peptidase [Acidimicrobiales bacterium]|nr:prolyl oligopeptidase family serine peptidase [Acidimicrobiales bacterium]MDP6298084.1 prolyl oligopeptidase family serine peptidase [Acidimicrobiales bacterium]